METTTSLIGGDEDFLRSSLLPRIDALTTANLEKFKKEREITDLKEQKRSTIEKLKKIKEINNRNQMEMNSQRTLENELLMKQELLKTQVGNADSLEKEVLLLKEKNSKLRDKLNDLKAKKAQLQRELNLQDIDRNSKKTRLIESNDINIKNYQRKHKERCDGITSKMSEKRKVNASLISELSSLNELIAQTKNKCNYLQGVNNDYAKEIDILKDDISKETREFDDKKFLLDSQSLKAKNDLNNLNDKIQKQKQIKFQLKNDYQEKKKTLELRTQELNDINNKIRIKSDSILLSNTETTRYKSDISVLENKYNNLINMKSKIETDVSQLDSQLLEATQDLTQSEKILGKLKLEITDLTNQITNQQIINDQLPDPRSLGQSFQIPYNTLNQQFTQPIYPYTMPAPLQSTTTKTKTRKSRRHHGRDDSENVVEGLNYVPLSKKVTIEQYQPPRRCSEFTHFLNIVYPFEGTRGIIKSEPDDKMLSQYLELFSSNPNYIVTNIKDEFCQTEPFILTPTE